MLAADGIQADPCGSAVSFPEFDMPSAVMSLREHNVLFLSTPALWPAWPFLPVVRRIQDKEELGVLFDSRSAGLTGLSSTVFLTCLFMLPPRWEDFLALPKETFDSAEEIFEGGWRVD